MKVHARGETRRESKANPKGNSCCKRADPSRYIQAEGTKGGNIKWEGCIVVVA